MHGKWRWNSYVELDATALIYTQGVMKVRRRVTLMVVVVTAIFGFCWGVNQIVHIFKFFSPYTVGALPTVVANTMVLINSAVNPFVFALLNHQFREKMKGMICCRGGTKAKFPPSDYDDCELTDNTNQPTYPGSTSSIIWSQCSWKPCTCSHLV